MSSPAGAENAASHGTKLALPDSLENHMYETGYEMVEFAWDFATQAHGEQEYAENVPYMYHLASVALKLLQTGHNAIETAVGVLHDSVEDTDITLDNLEQIFPEAVVSGVKNLTYDPERIVDELIVNEFLPKDLRDATLQKLSSSAELKRKTKMYLAREVPTSHAAKDADSEHNLESNKHIPKGDENDASRKIKYTKNKEDLKDSLPSPNDVDDYIAKDFPDSVEINKLSDDERAKLADKFTRYIGSLAECAIYAD